MSYLDQGVPEWDPADTGPATVNAAIRALVERGGMVFPTVTARDAAIPVADRKAMMTAYVEATGQVSMVDADGGDWVVTTDLVKPPLGVAAVSGTIVGGAPAAGARFIIQAGTVVRTPDANGYTNIDFPTPFPNGLVTFIAMAGESPGGARHIVTGPDLSLLSLGALTHANVRVFTDAGVPVTGGATTRVNWVAVGW